MVAAIDVPYVVQVDALYFQARETGVPYVVINKESHKKLKHPDFSWHFGFKALAGITLDHDCWHLWLQYLHFHARSKNGIRNKVLFPTWTHPLRENGSFVAEVDSRWRLHLGFIDLNLARSWPISCHLTITPYFGLRYGELRHKSRIGYRGGDLFPGDKEEISMKNKFFGLGPQFGISGLWNICGDFGFFSRAGVNLLYGYFYIHQDEEKTNVPDDGRLKLFDQYFQTRKVSEMSLGIDFRHYFERQCLEIYLRLGWEIYYLFGQNQHLRYLCAKMPGVDVTNLGDLMFHGLKLGLEINF